MMAKTTRPSKGFGHERGSHGETNDWLTPKYIIDEIGPFHLDPCAAPNPRPWDTAKNHITFPQDGLAADWEGRVFCNPPYGPDTGKWMKKMGEHNSGIALIYARVETKAWQEWVWPAAEGILFLDGRLAFYRPNGTKGDTAGAPSALVAFSPADAECLRLCTLPGVFTRAIGRYPDAVDIPVMTLTEGENYKWVKIFNGYLDEGWSDKNADRLTWLDMQNEFPHLLGNKFHAYCQGADRGNGGWQEVSGNKNRSRQGRGLLQFAVRRAKKRDGTFGRIERYIGVLGMNVKLDS